MGHQKRQKVPKNWPIHRKGTAYVISSNSKGIPLLIVLRDMLGLVQNRKEAKKVLHERQVLLNNKPVLDEKNGVALFDVISNLPAKKYYRLVLTERGKFATEEIKETEANHKVAKVVNKKTLKGKKTQINLGDGKNFLSDIKCNTNDSVLINLKNKKLEKCIGLKEKARVLVFEGKHAGEKGTIEEITLEKRTIKILNDKKEHVNVLIKQMLVTE